MQPTTHNNFQLYKRPFVLITLCFTLGVYVGFELTEYAGFATMSAFFSLGILMLMYTLSRKKDFIFLILVSFSCLIVGMFLMMERNGAWEKYSLGSTLKEDDQLVIEVEEFSNTGNKWEKSVGRVSWIYRNGQRINLNEKILLFFKNENLQLGTGDVILLKSTVSEIVNPGNPGEFDAENFWNRKGIRHMAFVAEDDYRVVEIHERSNASKWINSMRIHLRNVLEENLDGKELAISLALILGDKSLLDMEVKNSFTNTGAMHVLAVSGLHVGIIMQILLVILGLFPRVISRKTAVLMVVVLMWIYALITGLSPSVLRAVYMFSFLVLAQISGKKYDSLNILFFTGFSLVLLDPFTLFDIGFQLSFLAMLGIFLFYRQIDRMIYVENRILKYIWQGTAIGFAAQLMTTPLSLYYFHQFPNYFVLTNIGLMASSGLILGIGIFLFSFSWLIPLARFAGLVLSWVVFLSLWFIEWVEDLPGAVAYGFEPGFVLVLIITGIVLALFLWARSKWEVFGMYLIGLIALGYVVFERSNNLTHEELCVFNDKNLIITIKKGDELFCFYKTRDDNRKKIEFIVDSYRKLYPSKVQYFILDHNSWDIHSDKTSIKIKDHKSSIQLSLNGKKFMIASSNEPEYPEDQSYFSIGMPWVERQVDHSLKEGAYRFSL